MASFLLLLLRGRTHTANKCVIERGAVTANQFRFLAGVEEEEEEIGGEKNTKHGKAISPFVVLLPPEALLPPTLTTPYVLLLLPMRLRSRGPFGHHHHQHRSS